MAGDGRSGPLADLARDASAPMTLVFGTFDYRGVVTRWIEHARRAGCREYRIVCMDERLPAFLRGACGETRAVAYRALLPDVPWVDVDARKDRRGRLAALTPMRVTLFRTLAEQGIDFIHSDADAYWVRDPRPWLAERRGYDLLGSQGIAPAAASSATGTVSCSAPGSSCAAPTRAPHGCGRAVETRVADCPDDQVCLNLALLNDPAGGWRIRHPQPAFAVRTPVGRLLRRAGFALPVPGWFRLPNRAHAGERIWRRLAGTPPRRRVRRLPRAMGAAAAS